MTITPADLTARLGQSLAARGQLLAGDPAHIGGARLFSGFVEGWPELTAEVYSRTLVLHNRADPAEVGAPAIEAALGFFQTELPWLQAALVKDRNSPDPEQRRGRLAFGAAADTRLIEDGVQYALDLRLNQDTGFYLDTRGLRNWARANLAGRTVLNAFAYTGSLGVAALAGRARRVVQLDRSRASLNLARASCALNGFPAPPADILAMDFFTAAARLRRAGAQFDCVILDPPFFAASPAGRVDMVSECARLINKVRPLVADGGWLVAVNNALFVSGVEYLGALAALGQDGYLDVESLIPVPADCTGYPQTVVRTLPADPAPFNHATKIAVLRARRKSGPASNPGDPA